MFQLVISAATLVANRIFCRFSLPAVQSQLMNARDDQSPGVVASALLFARGRQVFQL